LDNKEFDDVTQFKARRKYGDYYWHTRAQH